MLVFAICMQVLAIEYIYGCLLMSASPVAAHANMGAKVLHCLFNLLPSAACQMFSPVNSYYLQELIIGKSY